MDPAVDRAHLPAPLAVDQGESSWLCAELTGEGPRGPRRFAVLAWLHRTGPRLNHLASGPGLLDHNLLPARVRELVPSWLPIITAVRIERDDRPLLMFVVYDLDRPDNQPMQIEREIEHADFDESTFSAATHEVALRVLPECIVLEANTASFAMRLEARSTKQAVSFGNGSPILRHGDIEIGYVQRSRLSLQGVVSFGDENVTVRGAGAHDRHWRSSTVTNLAWLWLHLRLPAEREINCYVLRDANAERGRGAWSIDHAGTVEVIGDFLLARSDAGYLFGAPALGLELELEHAIRQPYLRMRAFGDALDGGIAEGPIRITSGPSHDVEGWLEVFDASTCNVR